MKNSKKVLIIVIIIIAVLAIAGTVFGYVYMKTDTFKSNKELFEKYISQDIESLQNISKSNIYETYKNLKNENLYESNTEINVNYSEGGEVSNPFNDLSLKFKTQKDNEYMYKDAQILFQDEEYLEIEGIKDEEIYGIRFADALKQFLSVRDNGELNDLGLDAEMLEKVISIIDSDNLLINEIISEEELQTLTERYLTVITGSIQNATFSKQKNAMITLNNNTIETNSYIATLDTNQVQNLMVELLNLIKTDDIILDKIEGYGFSDKEEFIEKIDETLDNLGIDKEIPTIKITVYEQKGITVRTLIEIGVKDIVIENSNENGQLKTKIQRTVLNNEKQQEQSIEISKVSTETEENYNIKMKITDGEEEYSIESDIQMQVNNGIISTTAETKYTKGITNIEVILENSTNTTNIGEKIVLDEQNNVILSDLDEATRQNVLNIVKTGVPERINARIQALIEKLEIQELVEQINVKTETTPTEEEQVPTDENENIEPQMTQIEINRFNAKFEFYTGESVSAENVKMLLDIVKTNLESVEITPIENTENIESTNSENIKENIKLNIEKDKENTELANTILEKINDKKKYKVSISYNENGMINYITISEVEQ